jgi:hypothetical protein
MSRSLYQANQDRLNHTAKYSDFPVGSRVKVVCLCQDFYFFNPDTENTKGTVIANSNKYLGIVVKWDEPREYEEGYIQTTFNFAPSDLRLLDDSPKTDNEICYELARENSFAQAEFIDDFFEELIASCVDNAAYELQLAYIAEKLNKGSINALESILHHKRL